MQEVSLLELLLLGKVEARRRGLIIVSVQGLEGERTGIMLRTLLS